MRIALLLIVWLLGGCATPAANMDRHAARLGYDRQIVAGQGFRHVVYLKPGLSEEGDILHVYLDGDGTPWLGRNQAASDPTPHRPLMLDLMAMDPVRSIYLGRPCYLGMSSEAGCSSRLWTSARYSSAVVDSMSAALDRLAVHASERVLIGYSGGGTLAMLMAERSPKTAAVITVAANLDTVRWADMHRQPSLSDSLNPATRPALSATIRQHHYAGAEDDNVPPALIRSAIAAQTQAHYTEYAGQDHACCWREVWGQILGGLSSD